MVVDIGIKGSDLQTQVMGIRVIIFDDNTPLRDSISMLLKTCPDYTLVGSYSHCLDVIQNIKESNPDVVIMDINMPKMDGIEATNMIRKDDSIGKQPVIVALTANALAGDKERFLAAGMDDFISKPYKIDDIKNVIEKWLKIPAPNEI